MNRVAGRYDTIESGVVACSWGWYFLGLKRQKRQAWKQCGKEDKELSRVLLCYWLSFTDSLIDIHDWGLHKVRLVASRHMCLGQDWSENESTDGNVRHRTVVWCKRNIIIDDKYRPRPEKDICRQLLSWAGRQVGTIRGVLSMISYAVVTGWVLVIQNRNGFNPKL